MTPKEIHESIVSNLNEYNRRVSEVRDKCESGDLELTAILKTYAILRERYEELDAERKRLNQHIEAFKTQVVPEAMTREGVKNLTLSDIGKRFTITSRTSCSMKDKEAGMNWLRENGHGDIVQSTVNSGTLSALARTLLEESNQEMPEDIFKTSVQALASITSV